jgi:glycosyltransferase involved in cell wall biosynthesis
MKSITTISVGIPAYNEAANIKHLLQLLLEQKGNNFRLQHIFVVSDGSNDTTSHEVLSLKDKRIVFKDDRKRLGKSARLEEILRKNTSDVLILMDADIVIEDSSLFSKLIKQANFKKCGILAVNAKPTSPKTFFEHILDAEVYGAQKLSEQWNNGNNYLSFKGCFLALSGDLANKIHVPVKLVNNDAYLYFFAKQEGYTPVYVKDCHVYYHSPRTLNDHIKQSSRYQYAQKELAAYFKNIDREYKIPFVLIAKSLLQTLLVKHIYLLSYLVTRIMTKMKKHATVNSTWSIAGSTKQKIALVK